MILTNSWGQRLEKRRRDGAKTCIYGSALLVPCLMSSWPCARIPKNNLKLWFWSELSTHFPHYVLVQLQWDQTQRRLQLFRTLVICGFLFTWLSLNYTFVQRLWFSAVFLSPCSDPTLQNQVCFVMQCHLKPRRSQTSSIRFWFCPLHEDFCFLWIFQWFYVP